jgi:serine protease
MNRIALLKLLLLGLLTLMAGCSEPKQAFTLISVLPSPTVPGSIVTAFGMLPSSAAVYINELLVVPRAVDNGLEFTIPENVTAGTNVVKVNVSGDEKTALIQIVPRIDTIEIKDTLVIVQGAGWPAKTDAGIPISIEIAGMSLEATPNANTLTATLPNQLAYGLLSVQVSVDGNNSALVTLTSEASTLKGKVVFPATSLVDQSSIQPLSVSENASATSLIIYHQNNVTLSSLGSGTCNQNKVQLDKTLNTQSFTCASQTKQGLKQWKTSSSLSASKLDFSNHDAAKQALQDLQSQGYKVEWDVPIYIDGSANLNVIPSDGAGQWHLPLIGVEEAWQVTKGAGIVIGILDTGVMLDHPDLQPNLLLGYDFVDNDTEPSDNAGHGTHVAGLAAANGQVIGTAPEAKLLPVRVLEGNSGGSSYTVAQGILWAAGLGDTPNPNPVQVINLSLGSDSYSAIIAAAIEQAQDQDIIVVAATGNAGGSLAYPAALPGVVAVTSLAGPDIPYQPWYANKGLGVWITAYGGDTTQDQNEDNVQDGILSTDLGGYGLRMGTSMASPQIAGLIALALAAGSSQELAKDALANTASEIGPMGYDLTFGYGLGTGRVATSSTPRSYVVALDSANKTLGWTLLQNNNQYQLLNIPAGTVTLYAASDEDNDGRLGESGELMSSGLSVNAQSAKTISVEDLTLTISNGQKVITLEARP